MLSSAAQRTSLSNVLLRGARGVGMSGDAREGIVCEQVLENFCGGLPSCVGRGPWLRSHTAFACSAHKPVGDVVVGCEVGYGELVHSRALESI